MSPSYRKRRKAKLLERSRKGVQARERKRLERVQAAICVGTVTFDGPMFGGRHELKCLFSDGYSETKLMLANVNTAATKQNAAIAVQSK